MSAERTPDVDNGLSAVYYARYDYASFSRRLLAAAIDASVILALATAINAVVFMLVAPDLKRSETTSDLTPVFTLLLVYFAYAIVLRWSPISTVGYRICRLRIVNWRGDRPDLMHLIVRAICLAVSLFALGPIDFLWIFSGPYRLTLHDNVAQTFVVKTKAKPLGRAKSHLASMKSSSGISPFQKFGQTIDTVALTYRLGLSLFQLAILY